MKSKVCCFVLIILTFSFVCVKSRPFSPNHTHGNVNHNKGTVKNLQVLHNRLSSNEGNMSMEGVKQVNNEERKMIGSSPPSCEHKCYGCNPCEAIQVPTNTGRVGVLYTNYEPEGWKCKCGPAFYTP